MDLDEVIRQYHAALDEFSRGDPEPIKRLFSHREDVALANPFGPARRGWGQVVEALDAASSQFRDGKMTGSERIVSHVVGDLAVVHELEHWQSRVRGRTEITPWDLRVTSTFRREDGAWKLVQRHADPITTAHPDGPLRPMGG